MEYKRTCKCRMIRFWICLAGLSLLYCFEGLAAGPGQPETELLEEIAYTAVDGNKISSERLTDSVMEYEELGSLIHAYNPTVRAIVEDSEETRVKSYNDAIKRLGSVSSNRDRIVLERQLTKAAQGLMISWQSLSWQREYLEKRRNCLTRSMSFPKVRRRQGLLPVTRRRRHTAAGRRQKIRWHLWKKAAQQFIRSYVCSWE